MSTNPDRLWYWSSSLSSAQVQGWAVNFAAGIVRQNAYTDVAQSLRLVRYKDLTASVAEQPGASSAPFGDTAPHRFALHGPEAYDAATSLTWQRCSVGQQWTESSGCVGDVQQFSFDDALILSNGAWRVPTKDELATLIDRERVERHQSPFFDTAAFPGTNPARLRYWTGTPSGVAMAWAAFFNIGALGADNDRRSAFSVRLVRSGAASAEAPFAARSDRFAADEGEVYDRNTHLTWMRCSVGQEWHQENGCVGAVKIFAFGAAQKLADGHWRVPTRDELTTLIDENRTHRGLSPTLDVDAFPNMNPSQMTYWSSSTNGLYVGWGVSFSPTTVPIDAYDNPRLFPVRLVRSSQ
jgi:hypothetical protein